MTHTQRPPINLANIDSRFQSLQDQCNATGIFLDVLDVIEDRFVLKISIQRPHVRNALHLESMHALSLSLQACEELEKEDRLLALILMGCDKYFIAGGDLKALHQIRDQEQAKAMSSLMYQTLEKVERASYISFACIEGFAIGGGAEIALACDLRIMSQQAYWQFPQMSLGLTTGWGGGLRLQRILGSSKTLSILLQGQRIDAVQAQSWDLAQIVCPVQQTQQTAELLIKKIAHNKEAAQAIKSLLRTAQTQPTEYPLQEQNLFSSLWASDTHWQQVKHFWTQHKASKDQR